MIEHVAPDQPNEDDDPFEPPGEPVRVRCAWRRFIGIAAPSLFVWPRTCVIQYHLDMSHRRSNLAVVLSLGVLVGCGSSGGARPADRVLPADFVSWEPDRDAFIPARIRIHPLTRVTREARSDDDTDDEVLICHIELRDRVDQVVKRLGIAQVELLEADAQGRPRNEAAEPARVWQVDLRDPAENAAAFDDVVTRTYALHLGALPRDLAGFADSPDTGRDAPDRPSYALRVRFLFKDSTGEARQLETVGPLLVP